MAGQRLNLKMLQKALEESNLPEPKKAGQLSRILVQDYMAYINSRSLSSSPTEPQPADLYSVTVIAVQYGKGQERWLEWEALI